MSHCVHTSHNTEKQTSTTSCSCSSTAGCFLSDWRPALQWHLYADDPLILHHQRPSDAVLLLLLFSYCKYCGVFCLSSPFILKDNFCRRGLSFWNKIPAIWASRNLLQTIVHVLTTLCIFVCKGLLCHCQFQTQLSVQSAAGGFGSTGRPNVCVAKQEQQARVETPSPRRPGRSRASVNCPWPP